MIIEVGDIFTTELMNGINIYVIIESKLSEEKFICPSISYNFNEKKITESRETLNIQYILDGFTPFKNYNKLDLFKRLFDGNSQS